MKDWFHAYLNERGELANAFPSRLHTSVEVFDWLFTEQPQEGFDLEKFHNRLLCISGQCESNGWNKEKVCQCYMVKGFKDGFLFLYCLNDLTWSHYAIPAPLQKFAPCISRSVFDIYTGERFDVHILSNGMVLTVLAQYATTCVTLHNAILWHSSQPAFPPSRKVCAVEVVKMSRCYRCEQSPNSCRCSQNLQRITVSNNNSDALSKKKSLSSLSTTALTHDKNGTKESSSVQLHYDIDPNTVKTLFGPWKGTKRFLMYNSTTGEVEKERMSCFQLVLDWAGSVDVREVQTRFIRGMFGDLFNPGSDLVLSFSESDEERNYQDNNNEARGIWNALRIP